MSYHSETYSDNIRPIILDWLINSGRGKNVTDSVLTYANRAQNNLWEEKPWSNLVTSLEMSLTDNAYTLPSDFGRVVDVWGDLDGSGVPSYWYYEADDQSRGYKLVDSFDKSTGHSWVMSFHYPQSSTVNMRYQKILEDFTGEGTEYSYFPANLLLLEIQRLNTQEKGNTKEWQMFEAAYEKALKRYSNANQWVNCDTTPRVNDRYGNRITTQNYSLSGESVSRPLHLPNGYIL